MTAKFVALLPKRLQPFAKAVYPFVANLVYAGVVFIANGSYSEQNLKTNLLGLVGVVLTFLIPNRKD